MKDWERFFDAFAPRYDLEAFTKNTEKEVEFILEHLRPPAGGHILDVGCGTGRHSVALAQTGLRVTGVDLSRGVLELAQKRAAEASVSVEWLHADAATFQRVNAFDAAICLCEGAMCLLATNDDPLERDLTILRNVHASLRVQGRLLLNVLNGCRQLRTYTDDDVQAGRYDILNMTEVSDVAAYVPDAAADLYLRERGYTPPEIHRMLTLVGFRVLGIYGGTAGSWNLSPPKLDEMELMILADKTVP